MVAIGPTVSSIFIATVAAGAALLFRSHKIVPCDGVELVQIPSIQGGDMISVNVCNYFSESYDQARERFLRAAQLIPSARLENRLVYQDEEASDEGGAPKSYFMDICVVPGSLPGLVVHSSGVHGVEGFAGSAIQLAIMDSQFLRSESAVAERPTLVMFHAVNPHGMAHYRRFNENNVDLNRNALSPEEFASIQDTHKKAHDIYSQLESFFNPQHAPTLWNSYIGFILKFIWHLYTDGQRNIKAAMVGAQYFRPQGIFYGGNEMQRSTTLVNEWITEYLATQHPWKHDTITWVDVHTGLGPSGRDTLLPGSFSKRQEASGTEPTGEGKPAEYYISQVEQWFPDSIRPTKNSVNSGYEDTIGLYRTFFGKMLQQHDSDSFLLTQEFGTLPNLLVGHALMTENTAHRFAKDKSGPNSALEWAKRTTMRAFYVQKPFWRKSVLQQGVRVAWQAMERSKHYSAISHSEKAQEPSTEDQHGEEE